MKYISFSFYQQDNDLKLRKIFVISIICELESKVCVLFVMFCIWKICRVYMLSTLIPRSVSFRLKNDLYCGVHTFASMAPKDRVLKHYRNTPRQEFFRLCKLCGQSAPMIIAYVDSTKLKNMGACWPFLLPG